MHISKSFLQVFHYACKTKIKYLQLVKHSHREIFNLLCIFARIFLPYAGIIYISWDDEPKKISNTCYVVFKTCPHQLLSTFLQFFVHLKSSLYIPSTLSLPYMMFFGVLCCHFLLRVGRTVVMLLFFICEGWMIYFTVFLSFGFSPFTSMLV